MRKALFGMLALIAATLLSACNSDNYLDAIPSDTMMISQVDITAMVAKSGVMDESIVSSSLRDGVNSFGEDTRELLRKIIDNPEESGIDIKKPLCVALLSYYPNPSVLVTTAVKDPKKLETFIQTLLDDEMAASAPIRLSEKEDTKTLKFQGNTIGAFDDYKLVFVAGQDMEKLDVMEFMKLKDEKQAINEKKFDSFFDAKGDLVIALDYQKLLGATALINKNAGLTYDSSNPMFENLVAVMTTRFEKGKMSQLTDIEANSTYKKYYSQFFTDPSNKNLKCIPENATFVANAGIKQLGQALEVLTEKDKNEINKNLSEVGLQIEDFSEFEGDLTLALLPFTEMGNTQFPMPILMAECKGKKIYNALVKSLPNAQEVDTDVIALGANSSVDFDWETMDYKTITRGNDLYLGVKDNIFFVMPSDVYEQAFASGKRSALKSNFTDARLSKDLDGNGLIFDAKAFFQDPFMKQAVAEMPIDVTNILDKVIVEGEGLHSELEIDFQNKEQNALEIIKNLVMQVAAK